MKILFVILWGLVAYGYVESFKVWAKLEKELEAKEIELTKLLVKQIQLQTDLDHYRAHPKDFDERFKNYPWPVKNRRHVDPKGVGR